MHRTDLCRTYISLKPAFLVGRDRAIERRALRDGPLAPPGPNDAQSGSKRLQKSSIQKSCNIEPRITLEAHGKRQIVAKRDTGHDRVTDRRSANRTAKRHSIAIEMRVVTSVDTLTLRLAPGGGQAIRFVAGK